MEKRKKIFLTSGILLLVTFLSACGTSDITAQSGGLWEGTILYQFSRIILWLSNLFGGNLGIGIVLFVILIRIILLPITHFQTKTMQKMQELNPRLEGLREQYSAKDTETQDKLKKETERLYEDAGVNPYLSFLPILLQMPILLALYQAISRTPALRTGSFLWTQLGQPDPLFILPILAAFFTWWSSYLTTMASEQKGGAVMTYAMPLFILFVSIPLPSALSLYFVVSNAFSVLQTLALSNPYKIIRKKEEAEESERQKEKNRKKALKKAKRTGRNVKK